MNAQARVRASYGHKPPQPSFFGSFLLVAARGIISLKERGAWTGSARFARLGTPPTPAPLDGVNDERNNLGRAEGGTWRIIIGNNNQTR
jgi:hypothetical protein